MDRITLHGIRALGRHGANPEERETLQPFEVDLAVDFDSTRAQASDDIEDTVDYALLHARVVEVVSTTSFALLERLAKAVLDAVFADTRIVCAEVAIAKPGILDGATPSLRIAAASPHHRV